MPKKGKRKAKKGPRRDGAAGGAEGPAPAERAEEGVQGGTANGGATQRDFAFELGVPDEKGVVLERYRGGEEIFELMSLIDKELSEPYSIYTYRYFLVNWPELCIVARCQGAIIGCVVCKLEQENGSYAGYIAMLVVQPEYRAWGLGSKLVLAVLDAMKEQNADEVVLETEVTNKAALGLYEKLGFAREERLFRYYLNNNDAFRLKLWLR